MAKTRDSCRSTRRTSHQSRALWKA